MKKFHMVIGPLLGEIKKHLRDSVSHNVERSLYIYSGHDVNVVSLWRALGFEELLQPDYGASFAIELHEEVEQDDFYIRVRIINIC